MTIRLSDLLSQIGRSGSFAAGEAAAHYRHRLQATGRTDEKGNLVADVVKMPLPNGQVVSVPRLALMQRGALELDQLEVEWTSEVDLSLDDGDQVGDTPSKEPPTLKCKDVIFSMRKGMRKSSAEFHVKAVFKRGETVEAVEQIRDRAIVQMLEQLEQEQEE